MRLIYCLTTPSEDVKYTFSEDQTAAMTADFVSRIELHRTDINLQNPVVNACNLTAPIEDEGLAVDNIVLE